MQSAQAPGENLSSLAKENIAILAEITERDEARVVGMQLGIERISAFIGSPGYFTCVVAFICLWIAANLWADHVGLTYFDAPPFFWLQGIVSANALLVTVAVLIRQNRMAQLAQHRAHLDLQINLLTEQKVTKILQVIDDIRRQLPMPHAQFDAEVAELSKPADAGAILQAIKGLEDERGP